MKPDLDDNLRGRTGCENIIHQMEVEFRIEPKKSQVMYRAAICKVAER